MNNPFIFSGHVTGKCFCNRVREQEKLLQYIKSSQNILLYAHRRQGKSSLIKQIFQNIRDQKIRIKCLYIDIYGTTSEQDFIALTFKQLHFLESSTNKLLKLLKKTVSGISIEMAIDPVSEDITFSPVFKSVSKEILLSNLMEMLYMYSKKQKIVIVFDEFQEISKYDNSESFEKRLRSHVQSHDHISYIFSGSQQHLLNEMFNSPGRAFYKQTESFPLKKIETYHYVKWAGDFFKASKMTVSDDDIAEIITRLDNHPLYIQLFCFSLWEYLKKNQLGQNTIDEIEKEMIQNRNSEYLTIWENLTLNQKKTLKAIILKDGRNLYNSEILQTLELKTASVVTRSLKSLMQKEIIVKNGNYSIQDVLFKKWVSQFI
ncbi:ATPase [Candidatus Magnetomorum sp. HK-1]|nr:ATPase [Candidatus Magnetomorum sp. HK-1]